MTTIAVADLTQATLDGTGVFDVLMRANKAHLEAEFNKNRIKGAEYSTVYLGSLTQVMQTALQFLLTKEKTDLEAQLLQKQILLAQSQIDKAASEKLQIEAQTLLINQQKANLVDELLTATAQRIKLAQETLVVTAQKTQLEAQTANVAAELLNIPKQGTLLDAQKEVQLQQKLNLAADKLRVDAQAAQITAETLNVPKQGDVLVAQKNQVTQQTANLLAEASNIPKQGLLIDANKAQAIQQTTNLVTQSLQIEAQTLLITQQKANAIIEGTVLTAQQCKLTAEFDLTMGNVLKAAQETSLLSQKVATERAQVTALGVDDNSVVGRQKLLYQAQTSGFTRDAEQKAAKLMVDTWNVRRTTDEGTVADSTNKLADTFVGRAVDKLLTGVNA